MEKSLNARIIDICLLRQRYEMSCRHCVYAGNECMNREYMKEIENRIERRIKENEKKRK